MISTHREEGAAPPCGQTGRLPPDPDSLDRLARIQIIEALYFYLVLLVTVLLLPLVWFMWMSDLCAWLALILWVPAYKIGVACLLPVPLYLACLQNPQCLPYGVRDLSEFNPILRGSAVPWVTSGRVLALLVLLDLLKLIFAVRVCGGRRWAWRMLVVLQAITMFGSLGRALLALVALLRLAPTRRLREDLGD